MKEQLRQSQEQLQETRKQLSQQESISRPLESNSELQQKLEQAETTRKKAEARAEKPETRSKKIEDWLQIAKTEVGEWIDAKDNLIQKLCQHLEQQQKSTRQNAEQVEELEEYVKVQETMFYKAASCERQTPTRNQQKI